MGTYECHPDMPAVPSPQELAAAREVISSVLQPTPLIPLPQSAYPQHHVGGQVWLKWEGAQPTGSFKVRGGLAAVAATPAESVIVAASAGNHGLGLAWAAATFRREATIVLPDNAPQVKRTALEVSGARVVSGGPTYDTAEAHALTLASSGGTYISAYNNTNVIAGQATIMSEICHQLKSPESTTVVVPVGGGGLAAGVALAASSDIQVVGVETGPSRAVSTSVSAGCHQMVEVGDTIADGLAGNIEPNSVTPSILATHSVPVLAADEDHIARSVVWLAKNTGLIAEGSAVTPLAAWLHNQLPEPQAEASDLVFVVTGRNIDMSRFTQLHQKFGTN